MVKVLQEPSSETQFLISNSSVMWNSWSHFLLFQLAILNLQHWALFDLFYKNPAFKNAYLGHHFNKPAWTISTWFSPGSEWFSSGSECFSSDGFFFNLGQNCREVNKIIKDVEVPPF